MTTPVLDAQDMFREMQSTQVGLYVGLEEGRELDLRVAARAALAFDDFIRAFITEVEPETEVELTLRRSEVGSLNLISTVKAKVSKNTIKGLAAGAAAWLALEVGSYTVNAFLDEIRTHLSDEEKTEISEGDLRRIAEACLKATKTSALVEKTNSISQALAEDQSVTGLGLTIGSEAKPRKIRPRAEFSKLRIVATSSQDKKNEDVKRETEIQTELILTEPVLINKPRKWRFLIGKQEISAYVRDEAFRQKALQGKLEVPLSQGIVVNATLKTTEIEIEKGLWKPTKHEVMKVSSWKADAVQLTLLEQTPKQKK